MSSLKPGLLSDQESTRSSGTPFWNRSRRAQKSVRPDALRFLVQSGFVIIPRTTKAKHMQENLDVLTFTLDPDDMKRIESLDNAKSLFGWW